MSIILRDRRRVFRHPGADQSRNQTYGWTDGVKTAVASSVARVEHHCQRRTGNRGDGVQNSESETKRKSDRPFGANRPAVTGSLNQD
jgi:hypothetical protein